MIVALTLVAFGTSAPELVVNVVGAARGATDLAFGNVVGSNISNLALVLGAAAVMAPLTMQSRLVRREILLLLLATSAMTVMALDGPIEGTLSVIGRSDAIVLLLLFGVFIYHSAGDRMRQAGRRAERRRGRPGDFLDTCRRPDTAVRVRPRTHGPHVGLPAPGGLRCIRAGARVVRLRLLVLQDVSGHGR